jgi:hypothetical protein
MKKVIVITLALFLLATALGSGFALAQNGPKPGTDFNGPHYNLNIIGVSNVKDAKMNNPSRHTIFIPLVTDWYADPCTTKGPKSNRGEDVGEVSELPAKGVRLRIGPSPDNKFYVTDGNATNDKYAEFLMPATPNGFDVYLSGKGKPGGCLDVDAYLDNGETMYFIGHVDVDRKTGQPKWQNAKFLLYNSGGNAYFADPNDLYFWQLYNNNLRLMQVRFYPTS